MTWMWWRAGLGRHGAAVLMREVTVVRRRPTGAGAGRCQRDARVGHGLRDVGAAVGALGQQVTRIYGGLNRDRKGNEIRV